MIALQKYRSMETWSCIPNYVTIYVTIFTCCWEWEKLLQDLREAVVITLNENKGKRIVCTNYRRITLLSTAGKILSQILLNGLLPIITNERFLGSQRSFKINKGFKDRVSFSKSVKNRTIDFGGSDQDTRYWE